MKTRLDGFIDRFVAENPITQNQVKKLIADVDSAYIYTSELNYDTFERLCDKLWIRKLKEDLRKCKRELRRLSIDKI